MQFEFPPADKRYMLTEFQTIEELQQIFLSMKINGGLAYQSIAYNILADNSPGDLQEIIGLTVQFTCCDSQYQQSAIHFVNQNGKFVLLQQQSTFTHKHSQNFNKKLSSPKENLTTQQDQQGNNKSEKQPQNDGQEMDLSKKENSCNEEIEKQQQKIQKVFEFPTVQQQKKLQYISSKKSMNDIILQYLHNPLYKDSRIRFNYETEIETLPSGYKLQNLRLNFSCCMGINRYSPFLDYIKKSQNHYQLIDSSCWHDHREANGKRNIRQEMRNIKVIEENVVVSRDNHHSNEMIEQMSINNGYDYSFEEKHPPLCEPKSQMQSEEHINNNSKQGKINDDQFQQMQQEKQHHQEQKQIEEVHNQSQPQIDQGLLKHLQPTEKERNHKFKENNNYRMQVQKSVNQEPKQIAKRTRSKFQGSRQLKKIQSNLIAPFSQQNESQHNENSLNSASSSQNEDQNQSSSQNIDDESQLVFQFPNKQDLKKLKPAPVQNIRNTMGTFMKKYENKKMVFRSKTFDSQNQKGKKVHKLHFYFDCCKGTQKNAPFLSFIGKKNSVYTLKDFNPNHDHCKESDKNQNKSKNIVQNANQIKRIITRNISQSNTEKNSQQDNNQKRLYNRRANYASKRSQSIFDFPSMQDLEMIKPFSVTLIDSDLKSLGDRKKKKIKFHSQSQKNQNLKFYFDCCKGFEDSVPFLHFKFNSYEQKYILISSNRWHDHRKIKDESQKKKVIDNNDQILSEQEESQEQIDNENEGNNESQHSSSQNQENQQKSQNQQQEQEDDEQQGQSQKDQEQQSDESESQEQNIQEKAKPSIKRGRGRSRGRGRGKGNSPLKVNRKIIRKQKRSNDQNQSKVIKPLKGYQVRANRKSRQSKTVFAFPSKKELQRLNGKALATLRSTVSKMITRDRQKNLISYQGHLQEVKSKNGRKQLRFYVRFNCCQGFQNNKPFIHFAKKNNSHDYYVVEFQKWHDHSKKGKSSQKQKQIQERDKVKPVQSSVQSKESIVKEKVASNGKKYKQQMEKNHVPGRTKKISKVIQRMKANIMQNEQNFITPKKKNNNINSSSSEEEVQQQDQSFEKSNIIQISSQNHPAQHQQPLPTKVPTKVPTPNGPIRRQTVVKSQNPPSLQKASQRNQMIEIHEKNNKQQQLKSSQKIYYWLQRYNQKLSSLLLEKQLHHHRHQTNDSNFIQDMVAQFNKHFKQTQINQTMPQDDQIWTRCVLQILEYNKFAILSLQTCKQYRPSDKSDLEISNLLFLNKRQSQSKLAHFLQIYLAVYPITIAENSYKLFIAYTINSHQLQPQILWFYIFAENYKQIKFEDFLDDDCNPDMIDKVLNVSIKYFGLSNVNFIFTTLDYNIMLALDKLYATNSIKKSEMNNYYTSTMHFSCVDELSNNQDLNQNSQLGIQIGKRIRNSPNFSNIKASYKVLKTILSKDTQKSTTTTNPRLIYNQYRTFVEPFSNNCNNNKLKNGIGFFSSQLLYKQDKGEVINSDFVAELNSTFSQLNGFNHYGQVVVMVIKLFDLNLRKLGKMTIIPFELYQVQRQITNFNSLSFYQQKLPYSIQRIISNQAYELITLVSQCPYFIIQTIYKLIIVANEIIMNSKFEQSGQGYLCHDSQGKTTYKVNRVISKLSLRSCNRPSSNINSIESNEQKSWQCSCKFSMQTGLLCEHQILAVLDSKSSLFKQVSCYWKRRTQ